MLSGLQYNMLFSVVSRLILHITGLTYLAVSSSELLKSLKILLFHSETHIQIGARCVCYGVSTVGRNNCHMFSLSFFLSL